MDAKQLLEQFLQAGKNAAHQGANLAEDKFGLPPQGKERDAMLSGAGKGAMAAGALALLLGTSTGRRVTGGALKVGGVAAVAGLAYNAWQRWQQQANSSASSHSANPATTSQSSGQGFSPLPLDNPTTATSDETDGRSLVLLKAMIAAAKADGHIDDQERQRINQQFEQLGLDPEAARFIQQEINKPLNPEEIGALATSVEQAAEIYLVSRLVIDADNLMEKAYLKALAEALALEPELVLELESQVLNNR